MNYRGIVKLGLMLAVIAGNVSAGQYLDEMQRGNTLQEEANDIARQAAEDADYNAQTAELTALGTQQRSACVFEKVVNEDGPAEIETARGSAAVYVKVCNGKIERPRGD